MKRTLLLAVALLFCCTAVLAGAAPKKSQPVPAKSPALEELKKTLILSDGSSFIQSYKIEDGSAYIQLDSTAWWGMTTDQQTRIMLQMAGTAVWDKAGLLNAHFYVGESHIGRIARKSQWSGGGWEFIPD